MRDLPDGTKQSPPIRLRYRTYEFGALDVHIRMLRDTCQFEDPGGVAEKLGISSAAWPIFGVIWPCGEVLAHLMVDYDIKGKRILEVGCGIALASLVLNSRSADITATDCHPEAGGFLSYNTTLNQGRAIPYVRAGWADAEVSDLGEFDLIIGSDLLYEPEHVPLLATFIQRHTSCCAEAIIIDGGRGLGAKFSKQMKKLGFCLSPQEPVKTVYMEKPYKGRILAFSCGGKGKKPWQAQGISDTNGLTGPAPPRVGRP
jgi:predicted nicotinamide N-methyase